MGIAYDPESFWGVLFARSGSAIPKVTKRVLICVAWSAGLCVLQHYELFESSDGGKLAYSSCIGFLAIFIGILSSFRLNDAFGRWATGNQLTLQLHGNVAEICAKLIAYLPADNPECLEELLEMRRLMVLACVLLKMHVREEKDFSPMLECELLTKDEHARMTSVVATIASQPGGDGKKDRYPSRNRPVFVFTKMRQHTMMMWRKGRFPNLAPLFSSQVEAPLNAFGTIFEEIEFLAMSQPPLAYAQLCRLVLFLFLLVLPIAMVTDIEWWAVLMEYAAATIYMTADGEIMAQPKRTHGTSPVTTRQQLPPSI